MRVSFGVFSALFLVLLVASVAVATVWTGGNGPANVAPQTPSPWTSTNQATTADSSSMPPPTAPIHFSPPEPHVNVSVDFAAAEGFTPVAFEDVNRQMQTLFVLSPGKVACMPVYVNSSSSESLEVSLGVDFAGESPPTAQGVQFTYSPQTFVLPPGGHAKAMLTVKAESDAPTALYETSVTASTNTQEGIGVGGPVILVSNSAPNYYFQIGASLPNGPVSYQNGSFIPTVHPLQPSFEISAGGEVEVLFDLNGFQGVWSLNVTVPSQFHANVLLHPFQIEPRPTMDSLYLISVTADSAAPRGTYDVTVTATAGNMFWGNITLQRSFSVAVT